MELSVQNLALEYIISITSHFKSILKCTPFAPGGKNNSKSSQQDDKQRQRVKIEDVKRVKDYLMQGKQLI